MTSKKVLLGVGLLAALAIVYFAFEGYPPTDEGMEGAIGVAKRYRAEQINTEDVLLQDPEVQALLQTDVFYKLITDDEFQESVANEAITLLLLPAIAQDQESRHELNRTADLLAALNDDEVKGFIAEGRFEDAVAVMNAKAGSTPDKQPIKDMGKAGSTPDKQPIKDLGKAGSTPDKHPIKDLGKAGSAPDKQPIKDLGKAGSTPDKHPIKDLGKAGSTPDKHPIKDMGKAGSAPDKHPIKDLGKAGSAPDKHPIKDLGKAGSAPDKWTIRDLQRVDVASWSSEDFQRMADLAAVLRHEDIQNHIVAGRLDEAVVEMNKAGSAPDKHPIKDLGKAGSTPDKHPIKDLGKAGSTPDKHPIKDLGKAGSTPDKQPIKDMGKAGSTPDKHPIKDLGKAGSTPDKQPIKDMGKAGSTPDKHPIKDLGKAGSAPDKHPIKDLGKAGSTPDKWTIRDLQRVGVADIANMRNDFGRTANLIASLQNDDVRGFIAEGRFEDALAALNKAGSTPDKQPIKDMGKAGSAPDKHPIKDLGKAGSTPDKQPIKDMGKAGSAPDKHPIKDLGKAGSAPDKWTIRDMQRLSDFAAARDWSAADLKKVENVLRMDGFQRLGDVPGFQRLITSSPSFYQAMSDGNAKAFLAQSGIGE